GHAVPERRAADGRGRVRERRVPVARAHRSARSADSQHRAHQAAVRGAARRVALARAMATDPEVLIYDEPFTGLDPISMGMIVRLVRQMNYALGITSIVVSHDVEELAILADASYIIAGGKVAASGSFVELK